MKKLPYATIDATEEEWNWLMRYEYPDEADDPRRRMTYAVRFGKHIALCGANINSHYFIREHPGEYVGISFKEFKEKIILKTIK